MNKYILGINGMGCGMCEIHVEEAITKNLKVKKAKASHLKNNLIVICEDELTIEDFKKMFVPTGYKVTSFEKTTAEKKLFGWR